MKANNMTVMRDVLKVVLDNLKKAYSTVATVEVDRVWLAYNIDIITAALNTPPRNCDVGTPKEQSERFEAFCDSHWDLNNADGGCSGCPLKKIRMGSACEFAWMQMPYEGKEESNEQHQ